MLGTAIGDRVEDQQSSRRIEAFVEQMKPLALGRG